MKRLILIGGPPGIGKSTVAHALKQSLDGVIHREADMYFVDDDGEYHWDPSKIRDAHAWCQQEVREWMEAEADNIIVSNTFTQRWERSPYVAMAQQYGYEVVWMPMFPLSLTSEKLASYNDHGVPKETIQKMLDRMELN